MKRSTGMLTVCIVGSLLGGPVRAEESVDSPWLTAKPEAVRSWQEMRFGMFIHWGPVSLRGTEIGWSRKGPRRGRRKGGTGSVPMAEYDNLYKRFNPVEFDADQWVRIAQQSGMKYLVFTTKHHDGFSTFDSQHSEYDIMSTPYGKDICRQLADACHRHELTLGWYYSPRDWYHADFATATHDRYLEFYLGQLRELCSNYGKVGVLWFDGLDSPRKLWKDAPERSFAMLRRLQPDIVLNNRGGLRGDFDTPEQRIGGFNRERPWETCMTICRQWAWKPNDRMKSLEECLHALIRAAGGDGNLLFNVGPMPDGRIEPRQAERLQEMGQWLREYGESIYGTRGGPFKPGPWGAATCRGNRVYLHVLDWRGAQELELPLIGRELTGSRLLTGGDVQLSKTESGWRLNVAKAHQQELNTLIELTLDGAALDISAASIHARPSGSLAVGKPAKASNTYRNQHDAYGPQKALDDDPETRWATDAGTQHAWLAVELGEPKTIGRAVIVEGRWNRVRKFEIQVRQDDRWRTVATGERLGERAEITFTPVTARHFRLTILDSTEGPTIWELQLFPK
ncbi:alpha-L-fucosidase [Planctomycetota bacterium]